MNLPLLIMLVISDLYFGWLIISLQDKLLWMSKSIVMFSSLLLRLPIDCAYLQEPDVTYVMKSFCFVCAYRSSRAISVPEFAKSAFWMEVV